MGIHANAADFLENWYVPAKKTVCGILFPARGQRLQTFFYCASRLKPDGIIREDGTFGVGRP